MSFLPLHNYNQTLFLLFLEQCSFWLKDPRRGPPDILPDALPHFIEQLSLSALTLYHRESPPQGHVG